MQIRKSVPASKGKFARRACGTVLIVEGIAGALCSLPLMQFSGIGILGLVAAGAAIWLVVGISPKTDARVSDFVKLD